MDVVLKFTGLILTTTWLSEDSPVFGLGRWYLNAMLEGPNGVALGAHSYAHNLLCECLHLGKGITYSFCIQMDSDLMHSG